MAKSKSTAIDIFFQDIDYVLAKFKFVKSHFPDVVLGKYYQGYINKYPAFASKKVNDIYTNLKFETRYTRLVVAPYCELDFDYNNKHEKIIINSSPRVTPLCYLRHPKNQAALHYYNQKYNQTPTITNQNIIKFPRLSINLKNNNFNDKMINECTIQILNFIKRFPNATLDKKHMDSRIKKLLIFT